MKTLVSALILSLGLTVMAVARPQMEQTVRPGDEDNLNTVLHSEDWVEIWEPMVLYPDYGYYRFDLCQNEGVEIEVQPQDNTTYELHLYRSIGQNHWDRVVAQGKNNKLSFGGNHASGIYYLRLIPSQGVGGPYTLRYNVTDPD